MREAHGARRGQTPRGMGPRAHTQTHKATPVGDAHSPPLSLPPCRASGGSKSSRSTYTREGAQRHAATGTAATSTWESDNRPGKTKKRKTPTHLTMRPSVDQFTLNRSVFTSYVNGPSCCESNSSDAVGHGSNRDGAASGATASLGTAHFLPTPPP